MISFLFLLNTIHQTSEITFPIPTAQKIKVVCTSPHPFLWPCLIVCCRDSEEEKIARCCQLPWLCRIFERSCPNWCNLRHAQAPDRPDNSFYWRRNLFHARILQKCPQECKIRLYHLIGCYQWPFPSAWCFNRTVLTSRPRLRWYIFQSTDDKKWWR